ncbi:MAG TPA: MFS transporter [Dictyobacter sp.]|jgi:MFS family permease|nr:MFS transporter [Dictyobacter sp.]
MFQGRIKTHQLDFWKYWTGQTISNLGSSITIFVLPLLVYKLTGSALNLSITTAAEFLPYVLFGLLLGALMDRVNRKQAMIYADVGRALVIASIPLAYQFGILSVWWIYIVGFLQATLTICFEAGAFAAIPNLVDRENLVSANGRLQASYSGAGIAGPVLAGLLVALFPFADVLLCDALSFVLSALSLLLIGSTFHAQEQAEGTRSTLREDIVAGLKYVLGHPVLRNISLMMAIYNFVGATMSSQLVLFAKQCLLATDAQTSWLYSAGSVGVVVLSLLAGVLRKRWSFSRVALSALMLEGLLTIMFAWMRWYWVALVLEALLMGLGILFNINTGSLRQAIVPDYMLSRVMSIAGVLAWSAIPLGSVLGGLAITWTQNVALVFCVIGILFFLIPLGFSFTALGHAERYIPRQRSADQPLAMDIQAES